jgi:hypothetical protein
MPTAHSARTTPAERTAPCTGARGSQRRSIREAANEAATEARKKRPATTIEPTRKRSKPFSKKKEENEVAKHDQYACRGGGLDVTLSSCPYSPLVAASDA